MYNLNKLLLHRVIVLSDLLRFVYACSLFTYIFASGVDFGGVNVDHVIIFDFPKDPAEYIRRVGRTARAGRTGLCTVFAYGWQLPIARQIMGKNNNKLVLTNSKEDVVQSQLDSSYDMLAGNIASGKLWRNRTFASLLD